MSDETYIGRDGLTHTYTKIDWDPKLKIGTSKLTSEELKELEEQIIKDKVAIIEEILAMPPYSISGYRDRKYEFLIKRNTEYKKFEWQRRAVVDLCMIDDIARHELHIQTWRRTIQEQFWNIDLTHEEILDGKWKQFMIK